MMKKEMRRSTPLQANCGDGVMGDVEGRRYQLPGTPFVSYFCWATLPLKPATIALKIGHLAFQVSSTTPPGKDRWRNPHVLVHYGPVS